jgi:hypothetical protein
MQAQRPPTHQPRDQQQPYQEADRELEWRRQPWKQEGWRDHNREEKRPLTSARGAAASRDRPQRARQLCEAAKERDA